MFYLAQALFVNGYHYNLFFGGGEAHLRLIPHRRDRSLISAALPGGTCWDKLKVFITVDQNSYLLNAFHSSADESSLSIQRKENNGCGRVF